MVEPLNPHHLDPADPHNLESADQPVLERIAIATEGEDCDECVRKLRGPLMRIPGVCDVRVNTRRERVIVTFDARKTTRPICTMRFCAAVTNRRRSRISCNGGLRSRMSLVSINYFINT